MLRVALVSTGHEILRGHTVNTNAAWLARAATALGARVTSVRTVGDDLPDIVGALGASAAEADVVLVTGGLGPTEDDRTRDALARWLGVALREDAEAAESMRRHFARSGRVPGPLQHRQTLVPEGACAVANEVGTAPGLRVEREGVEVVVLPGPPREMREMFRREVVPRWAASGRLEEACSRVVWTAGLPEADVADAIEDLLTAREPVVGTHPDEGEVAVRLLTRGPGAVARADAAVATVVSRLGAHVLSTDEDRRIQHAVVAALAARGLTLACAESVTGGLVARMVTEVPGSSAVFLGAFVTYATAWKRRFLAVPEALVAAHGVVSAEVACAMAEGARSAGGSDVAVATTGVAGPGPDATGTPEGTVFVGLAGRRGVAARRLPLGGLSRDAVVRRAAVAALDAIRRDPTGPA